MVGLKHSKKEQLKNIEFEQMNYLPKWEQIETMVDGIFLRKYYTNHGVLAQQFERRLQEFLHVENAICMTNTGIGIMIASKALQLRGSIIIPAFAPPMIVQAFKWAGLRPILCDVDRHTYHLNTELLKTLIEEDTSAIVGINLFGGMCDHERIEELSERKNLKTIYISSDAIGQESGLKTVGGAGSCEIFSLNDSRIINCADGCVISTNDNVLASRLRNMRSSYGSGKKVQIEFTGNGRMSEIQAGIGLLSFDNLKTNIELNEAVYDRFDERIKAIDGIEQYKIGPNIKALNYQIIVLDINRAECGFDSTYLFDELSKHGVEMLNLEPYDLGNFNGCEKSANRVARTLTTSLLAIPSRGIELEDVDRICSIISNLK